MSQHLQALIDQANAEQIGYRDRESDVAQLNDYLANSDHSMAEFVAKQIIERQRNIHYRITNGIQSK